MKTVNVMIKIPNAMYEEIKSGKDGYSNYAHAAIRNGIVLSKGHGKLIDSNVLWDAFQDLGQDFYEAFDFAVDNAVIEADEESEDKE